MSSFLKSNSFLLAIAASAFLYGCGESEAKERTATEISKKDSVAVLAAFTVEKGNLSSSVRMPAELIAYQQVDLYAKVSSFIKKLYVDVGSEVKAGQILALMEAPELNSQLAGAESRLKSFEAIYLASKANYDRLLETSKTPGTISPNDLDIANAKQKSDLAQYESAKAAQREITDTRNYLEIRAPFNGVITARNVSAGAYVGPSGKGSEMPLFTLQEQKKLRLVVSVPEAYTGYMNDKTKMDFTVASLGGEKFEAKVSRLAGALDSRLRSQRTELDVDNSNKKLLPGMVAEVIIPLTGKESAFVIPSSAVLNSTEGVFVIKVQDNKTIWVPVTTGRSDDGKTEVFGDVKEKDILVKKADEEVRNGATAVNVKVE